MTRSIARMLFLVGLVARGADTANAGASEPWGMTCGPDAVVAGTMCLDRYEASVWRVPDPTARNANLVQQIQLGTATLLDLTAGGATQLANLTDGNTPCADPGQSCPGDIFAVSLPALVPMANITWFQAQEACADVGKRLPTSAEWQVGANGTPDSGPDDRTSDCNSEGDVVTSTGSRSNCVSARGAFDMVGNLEEWVADWVPLSSECSTWGNLSDDRMCLTGTSDDAEHPGALTRGGSFADGTSAGPLAVLGDRGPSLTSGSIGFRCAREAVGPLPLEVGDGVRVSRSGADAVFTWTLAAGAAASEVLRGHVSELPVGSLGADERCLGEITDLDTLTDGEIPAPGDAFWYLVRGENLYGNGPYGFTGSSGEPGAPRESATCP